MGLETELTKQLHVPVCVLAVQVMDQTQPCTLHWLAQSSLRSPRQVWGTTQLHPWDSNPGTEVNLGNLCITTRPPQLLMPVQWTACLHTQYSWPSFAAVSGSVDALNQQTLESLLNTSATKPTMSQQHPQNTVPTSASLRCHHPVPQLRGLL